MLWDADDRLLFKNSKVGELLAATRVAELGEEFEAAVRGDAYSGVVERAIGREDAYIRERLELRQKSGKPYEFQSGDYWLEMTDYSLDGGMTMTLFRDVTELRESQQKLREQEAFYGTILEALNEGVVVRAMNGDLLFHNRSATGGYAEGPATSKVEAAAFRRKLDLIDEDGAPNVGPSQFGPGEGVVGYVAPDGTRKWISVSDRELIRPGETAPYGYVQTTTDVTELKEREAELVGQERFYKGILDSLDEAIVVRGIDGRLIFSNPTAWRTGGVSPLGCL